MRSSIPRPTTLVVLAAALTASLAAVSPAAAGTSGSAGPSARTLVREVLLPSARENTKADTASLPLREGRLRDGRRFSFVITEASNRAVANRLGVTFAPKLANAHGTGAVQRGRFVNGRLVVRHSVDFSPVREVVPGPGGFPPVTAKPGAVGEPGYSPLVSLPDGTVINAPQVENATGRADKLLRIVKNRAVFQETEGFYEGNTIYYVSFDASQPDIAALEAVTYAPALNAAPGLGDNSNKSARSGIAPFVNGQTGADNPQRQGLNSALLGQGDPLNVTQTVAGDRGYSPLWDVHATQWTASAKAAAQDLRQNDFADIEKLAAQGTVTGPGDAAWAAIGAIVNCPVISEEH